MLLDDMKKLFSVNGKEFEYLPFTQVSRIDLQGCVRLIVIRDDVIEGIIFSKEDAGVLLIDELNNTLSIKTRAYLSFSSGTKTINSFSCSGSSIAIGNNNIQIGGGVIIGHRNIQINGTVDNDNVLENIPIPTVYIALSQLPELIISGSSDAIINGIDQPDVMIKITGTGDVEIAGQTENFYADLKGTGSIHAYDLMASNADLKVKGTGGIRATVLSSLKARISGIGKIKIKGNPSVRDCSCSGLGHVNFK